METKKSPHADLNPRRGLFMQIGLAVTIGLLLVAFNWTTKIRKTESLAYFVGNEIPEDIISTPNQEKLTPPPPQPQPVAIEEFKVITDGPDTSIEFTSESDEKAPMPVNITPPKEELIPEPEVWRFVHVKPEFPGGDAELFRYLQKNIRYPEFAKRNDISGKVYLEFVVDFEGNITNIKVLRSVDPLLDAEAIRVVQSMPKWKPGIQSGKAVNVAFTLPVNFVLKN